MYWKKALSWKRLPVLSFCTGATALHSLEHGFRTVVVEDACRGVSLEDIAATRQKLQRGGAIIVDSSKVT